MPHTIVRRVAAFGDDQAAVLNAHAASELGAGAPPLLLLHGFGSDQTIWSRLAPLLSAGRRVCLYDHMGCGRSDVGHYDPARYATLEGYADDLVEVLDALDLTDATLVGHSVSGMIGLLGALRSERIARLVMIGASPRYLNDRGYAGGFEPADVADFLSMMELDFQGWARALAPRVLDQPHRSDLAEELTFSFCRDDAEITRRFAQATFLSDQRDRLPRLIEAAPVGLFRADRELILREVNPRLCDLAGRPADDLTGRPFRELLTRSSQVIYALKVEPALLADNRADEIFLELAAAEGRVRPVLLTVAPASDGQGWAGAVFSAPERRAYELELVAARQAAQEAARARSRFLTAISHELRTPLTAILGAGFLIEAETDQDLVAERARLILSSAADLERLVDDVLDFTDLEGGAGTSALVPVDLAAVVQAACEAARRAADAKGLAFSLDIADAAAGRVLADPPRLRQIVRALTDNAVKFTSQGRVTVRVRRDAEMVRLEVADTGPGFDLADAPRLLAPFERGASAAHRGFGLGLATVQRLADQLGGRLEVAATPGQGSTFTVSLPLAAVEPAAPPPPTAPAPVAVDAGLQRVLFAEDNPQNQWVIRSLLEMQGYEVVIAENGAEALDRLDAEPFDLVLMDMQMPVMDGLDATRALRRRERDRRSPRTPVIMVTANVLSEHVAAALDAGADRHLSKPVSPDALAEAISQVLETAA